MNGSSLRMQHSKMSIKLKENISHSENDLFGKIHNCKFLPKLSWYKNGQTFYFFLFCFNTKKNHFFCFIKIGEKYAKRKMKKKNKRISLEFCQWF